MALVKTINLVIKKVETVKKDVQKRTILISDTL